MKKRLTFILVLLMSTISVVAQNYVRSYGAISSVCPQTGFTQAADGAIYIEFFDNCIRHPMYGILNKMCTNMDGSTTYIPTQYAGMPAFQLNAILISADETMVEERVTSTMGNMSLNMITTYSYMGDGTQPYNNVMGAYVVAGSGSSREPSSSTHRDATCSKCGGTGWEKTRYQHATGTYYYNSPGSTCPVCGYSDKHYHYKCYH